MPPYRLFLFGADGHIKRTVVLEGRNDDEAVAAAREHVGAGRAELWQGSRRVRRFDPGG